MADCEAPAPPAPTQGLGAEEASSNALLPDGAPDAALLRCQGQGDSGAVEFTPECQRALKMVFDWFDEDGDAALCFDEAAALFRCTEGEQLTRSSYDGLSKVVPTDSKGNVTFTGFLKLYALNYADAGLRAGDLAVWKDLAKLGFSPTLQHTGVFPPRISKPRSAFAVLGKRKPALKGPLASSKSKKSARRADPQPPPNPRRLSAPQLPVVVELQSSEEPPTIIPVEVITVDADNDSMEAVAASAAANPAHPRSAPRNAFAILGKKKPGVPRKPKAPHASTSCAPPSAAVQVVEEGELANHEDPAPRVTGKVNPFFMPRQRRVYGAAGNAMGEDESTFGPQYSPEGGWNLPHFPGPLGIPRPVLTPREVAALDWESFASAARADHVARLAATDELLGAWRPLARRGDASCHSADDGAYATVHATRQFRNAEELLESKLGCELAASLGLADRALARPFATVALAKAGRDAGQSWVDRYMGPCCDLLATGADSAMPELERWLSTWTAPHPQHPLYGVDSNSGLGFYSEDGSNSSWGAGMARGSSSAVIQVLVGQSGACKTAFVHHAAARLGYKVVEAHPGQLRSATQMKQTLGEATQSRVIGPAAALNNSIVLVDEADIVFDEDKGFYAWLKSLVASARCPVVVTCNRVPHDMTAVVEDAFVATMRVDPPSMDDLVAALQCVCLAEGVRASLEQLRTLARLKQRDPRACLNHLQFYCSLELESPRRALASVAPSEIQFVEVQDCDEQAPDGAPANGPPCGHAAPPSPPRAPRQCQPRQQEVLDLSSPPRPTPHVVDLHRADAVVDDVVLPTTIPDPVRICMFPPVGSDADLHEQRDEYGIHLELGQSTLLDDALLALAASSPAAKRQRDWALPAPVIRTVAPASGPAHGSTALVISGENLAPPGVANAVVLVGGRPCSAVSASEDGSWSATTPPMPGFEALGSAGLPLPRDGSPTCEEAGSKDEIESDDEEDDDFLLPPGKAGKSGHVRGLHGAKPTAAMRAAKSRSWPRTVRLELGFKCGKRVASASAIDLVGTSDAFFEYKLAAEPCDVGPATAKADLAPEPESRVTNSHACATIDKDLGELVTLLETRSLLEVVTCPPLSRGRQRGVAPNHDIVADFSGAPFVPGEPLRAALRAEAYQLSARQAGLTEHRPRQGEPDGLDERQRAWLKLARRVAEACLSDFALGASRGGSGTANQRRTHPSLLDHMPFVVQMCNREVEREAAKSRRRFLHYFSRLPHVEDLLKAASALEPRVLRGSGEEL